MFLYPLRNDFLFLFLWYEAVFPSRQMYTRSLKVEDIEPVHTLGILPAA